MAVGKKPSSFFLLLVALAILISISPVRDVDSKMLVPNGFPSWLSEVDKNFLTSTAEELRSHADLTVATDGKGNFKTVNEAVHAAPDYSKKRFVIYVKRGVYNEVIRIGDAKTNLTLVGDGREATIFSGNLNHKDGVKTFHTATLAIEGAGFMAKDLCIRNTAGPYKEQAVALRVSADRAVIHRCGIEAYQDTLYAEKYRQYYRECYITGTIDFICGTASAVFQHCQIEARNPRKGEYNVITAQHRQMENDPSGFSIQKCNITRSPDLAANKRLVKTYLGRPWGNFSTTVIMQSFLDDLIDPAGWDSWSKNETERQSTLFYGEFKNYGPGADTRRRIKWKGFHIITDPKEAEKFVGIKPEIAGKRNTAESCRKTEHRKEKTETKEKFFAE